MSIRENMTRDASIFLLTNREDLPVSQIRTLADELGNVAFACNWRPPAEDWDSEDRGEEFLSGTGLLYESARKEYPNAFDDYLTFLCSVANFCGWRP